MHDKKHEYEDDVQNKEEWGGNIFHKKEIDENILYQIGKYIIWINSIPKYQSI